MVREFWLVSQAGVVAAHQLKAACVVMAASSEPAPKATKLPGKYSLNKTLSDPISPFLKAAGYSWATRKVCDDTTPKFRHMQRRNLQAADAVGLTLTIEIRENSLFGHGSTWLGDADYQLSFSEVRVRRTERRFPHSSLYLHV